MSSHRVALRRPAFAAACSVPVLFLAAPSAVSAPSYDGQGYLNSTARCESADSLVVFGSTAGSRVAICHDGDGDYEYRGVRVRDGAKLIAPALRSADGAFTASEGGIDYMVTSAALVISAGEKVIRDEPMVDFHRAGSSTESSTDESSTDDTPTDNTPTTPTTPTPSTPLPPPLPAEVGGGDEG